MKKTYKLMTIFAALLVVFTVIVSADTESFKTENDPLVSLSYVEKVLKPELTKEILEKVSAGGTGTGGANYTAIFVEKGKTIMAKTSCEIILTTGNASVVITSADNIASGVGLNDLTASTRLLNGGNVPANHYVIVPRPDGRGVRVTSDGAYFMIRGEYTIE